MASEPHQTHRAAAEQALENETSGYHLTMFRHHGVMPWHAARLNR